MKHYQNIITICLSMLLYNCAFNTHSEDQQLTANAQRSEGLEVMEGSETKEEALSDYESSTIETSNGTIEIEPTVVSSTDAALEESNMDLLIAEGEYNDPLEFINRPIFKFNHAAYKYALIPLTKGYHYITPKPVKNSIGNVFDNIREPLNLINNGLSGEFSEAGINLGRFLINSTIGILGIFDPASAWFEIEEEPQNLAQTLAKYNVGSGAYIVLPILGQSDVRGTTSIVTEGVFHPTSYVLDSPDDTLVRIIDSVDDFSSQADLYMTLYEQASDPYEYFRNQHIQSINRDEMADDKQISEVNAVEQDSDDTN